MKRLLPTNYFHVVFTVPDELLNGIVLKNRRLFFEAMFSAASQTLLTLGKDKKRLGVHVGFTAVLHTWTRDLRFHSHLHCIVTGGGLSLDGTRWRAARRKYLFPVAVLSKLFRGKVMAALREAFEAGRLVLRGIDGFGTSATGDVAAWRRLCKRLYATNWVSYAKAPFAGAEAVYQYLGRYTHRVGLSNQRLVSATDEAITFRTRGQETTRLPPHEFLRRFLQHVLPHGFVKLRHYGLLAPGNVNNKLVAARAALEAKSAVQPPAAANPPAAKPTWQELLRRLTGIDVNLCLNCGGAIRVTRPLPRRHSPPRDTS